jgi:myo-inositol 2-dehydrogenase / D-chiro-inositol 1-dehydrogenase
MNANSNESELTRRQFIKTTTQAAAGLSLVGGLTVAQSARAAGDDTIKLALVGCGGRGSGAADQALSTSGKVKLVAMADTFDTRLQLSLKELHKKHPNKVVPDEVQKFVGFDAYKKAIAQADIVILATSPGFRSYHFEEAVKQGKHAFLEKPLATDVPGVHRILAANVEAKKKNLKIGVGFQRHHEAAYLETYKRVKDGAVGEILAMRVYWRGGSRKGEARRPGETEMQYQIRNWYFFTYLSGDHIVEQHCHNIDVGNWFKGAYPVRATGVGGRQTRTNKECGQIFDHHAVEFEYADGCRMFSQCSQFPARWGQVSEHILGSKGTADMQDNRGFTIKGHRQYTNEHFSGAELLLHPQIPPPDSKGIWEYKGPNKVAFQVEHDDLFAAIRNNTPYNEADYGAYSTMTAIMGRMASYSGAMVEWKDAFNCKTALIPKAEFDWDEAPPVVPGKDGTYPTFHPGITDVC